jgi:hypothetical protein
VNVELPKPRDEARLKPEFLAYVADVAATLASAAKAQNKT